MDYAIKYLIIGAVAFLTILIYTLIKEWENREGFSYRKIAAMSLLFIIFWPWALPFYIYEEYTS